MSLDALRTRLMNDPNMFQEVRVDQVVDLTSLGAAYQALFTVPLGGRLRYAGLFVQTAVGVSSASGLSGISLGRHGTSATLYLGTSCPLTASQGFSTMVHEVPVTAAYSVDLCGVNPNGTSLSVTNITAGKVHVVAVYDQPNQLAA